MSELFPEVEIVSRAPDPPPEPNKWPYFIVAYWPRDQRWEIKAQERYARPDGPAMEATIHGLRERGWTHITLCKLPDLVKP